MDRDKPSEFNKNVLEFMSKESENHKNRAPNPWLWQKAAGTVCYLRFGFHLTAATAKPHVSALERTCIPGLDLLEK